MQYRRRVVLAAVIVAVATVVLLDRRHGGAPPTRAVSSTAAGSAVTTLAGRQADGRRVAGVVLLDDTLAPGVLVRLDDAASVRTDSTGHFDLGAQRIGRHVVMAEAAHVTGAFRDLALDDPATDFTQLVLVMHPCTASLHGTIRDAAGGTIAHARVAMDGEDDLLGAGVESADDGRYELCFAEGLSFVVASADGYASVKAPVVAAGRARRDFLMVPEAPVIGRVVRTHVLSPVPGAEVVLNAALPGSPYALALHATAGSDGRFRIGGAPSGRHTLTARADHLATVNEVPVLAEIGAPPEDVVVEVAPVASVSGKVLAGGQPVVGAWVELMDTTELPFSEGEYVQIGGAYSQRDGTFSVEHVPPGHYRFDLSGYEVADKKTFDIAGADITGIVLDVSPRASVAGRITHAGKPVEGASVRTDGGEATTDAAGTFTIRDLSAAEHQIYAESKRLGVFTHGPTITLKDGEQRTGVEIEMELSASIAGTVIDQDGAAVSGVVVQFSLLRGEDSGQVTTAEDGSFNATALSGGGAYVYQVESADGAWRYPSADGRHLVSIAVVDGQTHVTGVQIRIRRERKVLAGHVTTTAGAPVADAVVRAELRDRFIRVFPGVTTDTSGAFRIEDVPSGTYRVIATTPHGEETAEKIAAGRTDIVIKLPEPATIDGTLEGFADPPPVYAMRTEGFQSFYATVHGNSFTLGAIPPGEYDLSANSTTETVTVAPGGHASVVLRKRANGSIAGTVLDEDHGPIAGLTCRSSAGAGARTTDADGHFRFDDVPAGRHAVICRSPTVHASGAITVQEGQAASLELTAVDMAPRSRSGMRLENQFEHLIVDAVDPGGPAEQAGIQIGDVIVSANGKGLFPGELELRSPGTTLTLVLERGDKQLSVSLTLAPP